MIESVWKKLQELSGAFYGLSLKHCGQIYLSLSCSFVFLWDLAINCDRRTKILKCKKAYDKNYVVPNVLIKLPVGSFAKVWELVWRSRILLKKTPCDSIDMFCIEI